MNHFCYIALVKLNQITRYESGLLSVLFLTTYLEVLRKLFAYSENNSTMNADVLAIKYATWNGR